MKNDKKQKFWNSLELIIERVLGLKGNSQYKDDLMLTFVLLEVSLLWTSRAVPLYCPDWSKFLMMNKVIATSTELSLTC
jgi:hypothetical protein